MRVPGVRPTLRAMTTVEPPGSGDDRAAGLDETHASPSARRRPAPAVAVEEDDLLAGRFDQTNGLVTGLDGESDGTVNGEIFPAAFRTGALRPARLWDPHRALPEAVVETDDEPVNAAKHRISGRGRRH
jgi:hypothetical protein